MRVNSLKELEQELMKRVNTALATDVSDVVADTMTDHIIEDVYNAYTPKAYVRRYHLSGNDLGEDDPFDDTDNIGLLNPHNIVSAVDENGRLSVQNITLGSHYYFDNGVRKVSRNYNKPIDKVIETGVGYDVHGWKYDGKPRPFIQNTHDDLKSGHQHTEALKQGLRKQGLEVK